VSSYLDRLAARLVEPRSHIRPRPSSRFEVADAPATLVEEVGMASEGDTLRARPMRAADDRGDVVRQVASTTPPLRTEATATHADPHPASATNANDITAAPSALDASTAEAPDIRARSRHDLASPRAKPFEAPPARRSAAGPTIRAAMPASFAAQPPPQDAIELPGIEDRIAPWRAPTERPAEPAIDTRTATQGPIPTANPQQHDKAAAAADDKPAVVQVTIGRLEVRAAETPRRPVAKPTRAAPRMSLQDYLQRRTEGRAR
jgi:hypothetical protein